MQEKISLFPSQNLNGKSLLYIFFHKSQEKIQIEKECENFILIQTFISFFYSDDCKMLKSQDYNFA